MTDDLFQRGLKIRKEVIGADHVERSLGGADDLTRPFQELATKYCWGEIWGRPGLDRKTRSVANIAMMVALNRPAELRIHVKAAIGNGLTRAEIGEVLLQTAVYCGIPAAGDAYRNAKEVLDSLTAEAQVDCSPVPVERAERIAFFGLGAMGYPMAEQLIKAGFSVQAYDIHAPTLQAFNQQFGASVDAPAEAVADADIVITILPTSAHLSGLLYGDTGIAPHLKKGALLIDMTSGDPARSRDICAQLQDNGVAMIDAPVSGGNVKARTGELAIMVGGEACNIARAMPVLQVMGKSIVEVGGIGAGHAVKALNNYISAVGWLAVIEALQAGRAFGLDIGTMNRVFNQSSGRNSSTANKVEQAVLSGTYDTGFSLALMEKDVATALGLAKQMGLQASVGALSHQIIKNALEEAADKTIDNSRLYDIL